METYYLFVKFAYVGTFTNSPRLVTRTKLLSFLPRLLNSILQGIPLDKHCTCKVFFSFVK